MRGHFLKAESRPLTAGFTLIETLVAILLISVAIIAPMSLTVQSLSTAYFARDQMTASYLAQEGIEVIRSVRDANILATAEGNTTDIFNNILSNCQTACYVDATNVTPTIAACTGGVCPVLDTSAQQGLYSYKSGAGWIPSDFTRTIKVSVVRTDPVTGSSEEIKVTSTVSWKTESFQIQYVTLTENLYNWVEPGSAT